MVGYAAREGSEQRANSGARVELGNGGGVGLARGEKGDPAQEETVPGHAAHFEFEHNKKLGFYGTP
jgi:hypothetical protein